MTNETAPQKPKTANFSVKTDMVGFSRTQQVEITETVLGETSGFIIKLVIEKSRTQGFPGVQLAASGLCFHGPGGELLDFIPVGQGCR